MRQFIPLPNIHSIIITSYYWDLQSKEKKKKEREREREREIELIESLNASYLVNRSYLITTTTYILSNALDLRLNFEQKQL